MKKLPISIYLLIFFIINFCIIIPQVFAQSTPPSSSNYKVLDYGFNSGGTASSSSTNYSLFGSLGQVDQGSPSSTNYFAGAGLEYEIMASAPAAPTFVNQASNYNKLHLTINRGGNDPTDYQYAIQVASDNQFTTNVKYVQSDNTLNNGLPNSSWQSYSTWGGSSGFDIIGLAPGTTYYARVAARQGQFYTQSIWGPSGTATTSNSTFSFTLSTNSINLGTMTPASVTTSGNVTTTISTNGTGGGTVYIYGQNSGLTSSSTSDSINSSSTDLTGATKGYGAQGTSTSQSSGGPMEIVSPYNGVSNNVGVLDTTKRVMFDSTGAPVTSGQGVFQLKAKPSNTTKAATDYTDTLTVIASAVF